MNATRSLEEQPPKTRDCRECGQPFELPPFSLMVKFVFVCPICSERHAEADQRKLSEAAPLRRAEAWKRLCPPAFIETEPHKLPSPGKLQRVLQWHYGSRGLVLNGPPGTGKSRCAWELMKREFVTGRKIEALDCRFSFEYAARYGESPADLVAWMDRLMQADVLLLDDVFKCKLTASLESALFAILNFRTERKLPVILVTNDTGDSLNTRISEDRAGPMIRRIREFAETITFSPAARS